jgi:nicotinate dehydrogenase subunit A
MPLIAPRGRGHKAYWFAAGVDMMAASNRAAAQDRGTPMATYDIRINGSSRSTESDDPDKPLLYVLRGLGLTAAKFGCGLGQCGACTVLMDGQAIRSCQVAVSAANGKTVTTLEGLGSTGSLHPLQTAFIAEQVPQCGYCTNGMIMSAAGLLAQNKKPSEPEVRAALDGNLCRCGTHVRVVTAVMRAAQGG